MSILRVTRGKVRSGSWEEYEAALRKTIAEVGSVPGLLSRTLARDLDQPDSGYAISLWESEEALATYEGKSSVEELRSSLHSFFVGDFESKICEVRYWDETSFENMPSI